MTDPTTSGPASLAPRLPSPFEQSGADPLPTGQPQTDIPAPAAISPARQVREAERQKRTEAKAVTRKDVTDLFASFTPEAPKTESAAEKERKRRVARWETNVRQLATAFEELGGGHSIADSAAALKALQVTLRKGIAAIEALSDSKLDPAQSFDPKPPRAPRGSRQSVPAPEPVAEDETPAVLADPEPEHLPYPEVVTPTDIPEGAKVVHRRPGRPAPLSTTIDEAGPRGAEDPNAGDGF